MIYLTGGGYIKIKNIVIISLLIVFIILTYLVITDNISFYDDFFIEIIRNITEFKTMFFKFITDFGDFFILVVITVLIFARNKKYGIYVLINLLLSSGINSILKLIFVRERPLDMLISQGGYSYPSGHSFVSLAFYGFLIYLVTKMDLKPKIKNIIIVLLVLLISLIGISRIYLGVHYPSDVLGGFICGLIYLLIYVEIVRKIEVLRDEKKKKR